MSPTAINYNPSATLPGECVVPVSGCLDPDALNFYKGANTDRGNCAYGGCTDSSRPNYDPTATIDDGRCAPLFPGCTNPLADNYNALYNLEDGSCRIAGCVAHKMQLPPLMCRACATVRAPLMTAGSSAAARTTAGTRLRSTSG